MRKLLAILFLFPLLCFGQSSKTPLNRSFLQSNMDANGLMITNSGDTYLAPSWSRALSALGQSDLESKPTAPFVLLSFGDSVATETTSGLAYFVWPLLHKVFGRTGVEFHNPANSRRAFTSGTVAS